ncbi:MAG: DUF2971 domain-containing protein [Rhodobacteraceae bacterium]|nr:DUF2971 domain-containing protein [Paracoccaceae bacterium]
MASNIIPKKLYRFRPAGTAHFEEELRQAVLFHKVWCSPMDCQNDPFEALPVIVDSSIKELKEFLSLIRKRHGPNTTLSGSDMLRLAKEEGMSREQQKEVKKILKDIPYQRKLARDSFLLQRKATKIAAFCENSESLLLWAHYAASHQGIRIDYAWEESSNISYSYPKMVRVRYTKDRPILSSVDIAKYVCGGVLADQEIASKEFIDKVLVESILTKSLEWEYECEWRLVVVNEKEAGYAVTLPLKVISITCGASASKETIATCLEIAGGDVPIYQSRLSDNYFSVKEEKIN